MRALLVALIVAVSRLAVAGAPSAPRTPVTADLALVVEVPVRGDVMIAGKVIADRDLDRLFRAAAQRDKNTRVVFRFDKATPHSRIVSLMSRAKNAGLTQFAIATAH